jgi:hypothetical protein
MKILLLFIFLQLADFGTTVAVISMGGTEANPTVRFLMGLGVYGGLATAKVIGLGLGGLAAFSGRYNGLRKLNIVFAVIVLWNLSIIGRLLVA